MYVNPESVLQCTIVKYFLQMHNLRNTISLLTASDLAKTDVKNSDTVPNRFLAFFVGLFKDLANMDNIFKELRILIAYNNIVYSKIIFPNLNPKMTCLYR